MLNLGGGWLVLSLGGGWLVLNLLMNFSIELGFGDWSLDFLVLGVAGFLVVLSVLAPILVMCRHHSFLLVVLDVSC